IVRRRIASEARFRSVRQVPSESSSLDLHRIGFGARQLHPEKKIDHWSIDLVPFEHETFANDGTVRLDVRGLDAGKRQDELEHGANRKILRDVPDSLVA